MADYLIDREEDGSIVEFYANGNKRREGRYVDGKKEGRWILYHSNGNQKSDGHFRGGMYEGHYVSYHKNGNRFREGDYGEHQGNSYDGKKEGVWHQYAEDGETVEQRVTYKHGKVVKRERFDLD